MVFFLYTLNISEAASENYGWPLHIVEEARDDPKLERPEVFVQALYAVLESSETNNLNNTL